MSVQRVSKALFCAACGTPAVKRGASSQWVNGCAHVGSPVRMGRKRADDIAATFIATRDARIARALAPVADCAGVERHA